MSLVVSIEGGWTSWHVITRKIELLVLYWFLFHAGDAQIEMTFLLIWYITVWIKVLGADEAVSFLVFLSAVASTHSVVRVVQVVELHLQAWYRHGSNSWRPRTVLLGGRWWCSSVLLFLPLVDKGRINIRMKPPKVWIGSKNCYFIYAFASGLLESLSPSCHVDGSLTLSTHQ